MFDGGCIQLSKGAIVSIQVSILCSKPLFACEKVLIIDFVDRFEMYDTRRNGLLSEASKLPLDTAMQGTGPIKAEGRGSAAPQLCALCVPRLCHHDRFVGSISSPNDHWPRVSSMRLARHG